MENLKDFCAKNKQDTPPVLQIGEDCINDPSEVANVFNNYFTNISNKYISARRSELDTKSLLKISNLIDNKINDTLINIYIPHITNAFLSHKS